MLDRATLRVVELAQIDSGHAPTNQPAAQTDASVLIRGIRFATD